MPRRLIDSADTKRCDSINHTLKVKVEDLNRSVIVAIATVKCLDVATLEEQLASQGERFKVTAKEAKAVGAMVEECYGCQLLRPSDFGTEKTTRKEPGQKDIRPNGCMDAAEDTSVSGILGILTDRLQSKGRLDHGCLAHN